MGLGAAVVERRRQIARKPPVGEIDHRHGERQRMHVHADLVHLGNPQIEVDETKAQRADLDLGRGDRETFGGDPGAGIEARAVLFDQPQIAFRVVMGVDVDRRMVVHHWLSTGVFRLAPDPGDGRRRIERRAAEVVIGSTIDTFPGDLQEGCGHGRHIPQHPRSRSTAHPGGAERRVGHRHPIRVSSHAPPMAQPD